MNLDRDFTVKYVTNNGDVKILSEDDCIHLNISGNDCVFTFGDGDKRVLLQPLESPIGKEDLEFCGNFHFKQCAYTVSLALLDGKEAGDWFLEGRIRWLGYEHQDHRKLSDVIQDDEEVFGAEASP